MSPLVLATRFWPAFLATLDELAEHNYFASRAGAKCSRCHKPFFWRAATVKRALTAETGIVTWPVDQGYLITDDKVIGYVEAFYLIVAKPKVTESGPMCGVSHPVGFDVTAGRYEYTCKVNALLDRFGAGLRLERGAIRSLAGKVVPSAAGMPFGGDEHLRTLVRQALEDYRSPDPGKRWSSLGHLANALERVKTTLDPSDKSRSVRMLVAEMSADPALVAPMDALLRAMTLMSNVATIRHHEVGKAVITEDGLLIDFLFDLYFSMIKFAMGRLDIARGQHASAVV